MFRSKIQWGGDEQAQNIGVKSQDLWDYDEVRRFRTLGQGLGLAALIGGWGVGVAILLLDNSSLVRLKLADNRREAFRVLQKLFEEEEDNELFAAISDLPVDLQDGWRAIRDYYRVALRDILRQEAVNRVGRHSEVLAAIATRLDGWLPEAFRERTGSASAV